MSKIISDEEMQKMMESGDVFDPEESESQDSFTLPEDKYSAIESAALGAAEDLTFGFADEIYAQGRSKLDELTGNIEKGKSVEDVKKEYLKQAREYMKGASQEDPGSYIAGGVAGAFVPALATGGASVIGSGAKLAAKKAIGKEVAQTVAEEGAEKVAKEAGEQLAFDLSQKAAKETGEQLSFDLGEEALDVAAQQALPTLKEATTKGLAIGAGQGALYGAGMSESEDAGGIAQDALIGAGLGAGIGAVAPSAIYGASKGIGKAKEQLEKVSDIARSVPIVRDFLDAKAITETGESLLGDAAKQQVQKESIQLADDMSKTLIGRGKDLNKMLNDVETIIKEVEGSVDATSVLTRFEDNVKKLVENGDIATDEADALINKARTNIEKHTSTKTLKTGEQLAEEKLDETVARLKATTKQEGEAPNLVVDYDLENNVAKLIEANTNTIMQVIPFEDPINKASRELMEIRNNIIIKSKGQRKPTTDFSNIEFDSKRNMLYFKDNKTGEVYTKAIDADPTGTSFGALQRKMDKEFIEKEGRVRFDEPQIDVDRNIVYAKDIFNNKVISQEIKDTIDQGVKQLEALKNKLEVKAKNSGKEPLTFSEFKIDSKTNTLYTIDSLNRRHSVKLSDTIADAGSKLEQKKKIIEAYAKHKAGIAREFGPSYKDETGKFLLRKDKQGRVIATKIPEKGKEVAESTVKDIDFGRLKALKNSIGKLISDAKNKRVDPAVQIPLSQLQADLEQELTKLANKAGDAGQRRQILNELSNIHKINQVLPENISMNELDKIDLAHFLKTAEKEGLSADKSRQYLEELYKRFENIKKTGDNLTNSEKQLNAHIDTLRDRIQNVGKKYALQSKIDKSWGLNLGTGESMATMAGAVAGKSKFLTEKATAPLIITAKDIINMPVESIRKISQKMLRSNNAGIQSMGKRLEQAVSAPESTRNAIIWALSQQAGFRSAISELEKEPPIELDFNLSDAIMPSASAQDMNPYQDTVEAQESFMSELDRVSKMMISGDDVPVHQIEAALSSLDNIRDIDDEQKLLIADQVVNAQTISDFESIKATLAAVLGVDRDLLNYAKTLAQRESSNNYGAVRGQFLGKYQIGNHALMDLGYKDANGNWTGKGGIQSNDDFLNSPDVQESVFKSWVKKQDQYLSGNGVYNYVGKTFQGIPLTKEGLRAAAHLVGHNKLKEMFATGKVPQDALGTKATDYLKMFSGSTNRKIASVDRS